MCVLSPDTITTRSRWGNPFWVLLGMVVVVIGISPRLEAYFLESAEAVLEAYYAANGIWIPHRVERFADETLLSQILIRSVEMNIGVFDAFFRRPLQEID